MRAEVERQAMLVVDFPRRLCLLVCGDLPKAWFSRLLRTAAAGEILRHLLSVVWLIKSDFLQNCNGFSDGRDNGGGDYDNGGDDDDDDVYDSCVARLHWALVVL